MSTRPCFREPIAEIIKAAEDLDLAVTACMSGRRDEAAALIRGADLPIIRDYTESVWGKNSPYIQLRPVEGLRDLPAKERDSVRMPGKAEKAALHARDGYYCRFCAMPVIRAEIRDRIRKVFPDELGWGRANRDCHAAFQVMWAQYDHVLPHCRGGTNALDNLVVTCAPCNFGRMSYTLEEVGISDPRLRAPVRGKWDGLERFTAWEK